MSHLLQMRGLKHKSFLYGHQQDNVASFTDAWIETEAGNLITGYGVVASFTDAWIETSFRARI